MPGRSPSRTTGERVAVMAADEARELAAALAIAPADPGGVHEARTVSYTHLTLPTKA